MQEQDLNANTSTRLNRIYGIWVYGCGHWGFDWGHSMVYMGVILGMSEFNRDKIKNILNNLTLSLSDMNNWAEISRGGASIGWCGAKFNVRDVVTVTTINVIGIDIKFTALFTYSDKKSGYHDLPDLVKMEVME